MKNILNKLFSVKKSKCRKSVFFLGKHKNLWNYKYMIREMYRFQSFLKAERICKMSGIALPPEAEALAGEIEIVKVPLKDIRRLWQGKRYDLKEVSPFKYLQTRDKAVYAGYIQKHIDLGICSEDTDKTPAKFEALEKSMDEKGYDPSKCVVVLNMDNEIIDGQHRCCILLYKYGSDYEVMAVREKRC